MLIHNADITGSLQINGTLFNTGSFSGSFTGDGSQLDGVTAVTASYIDYNNVDNKPTLISGSSQIAGLGYAITGSNQFDGSQAITGSLTVTGDIIAQTLNVQQVTSSVVYSSGSNVFGNNLSNTHQFTGSMSVTGSLSLNGLSAITGTGTRTENFVAKFGSDVNTIQNSQIFDNGTSVIVNGSTSSDARFIANGNSSGYAAYFSQPSIYAGYYRLIRYYTNGNVVLDIGSGNGTNLGIVNNQNDSLYFGTNGQQHLTIFGSGNVHVGLNPSSDAGFKLDVNGTGRFSGTAGNGSAFFNLNTTSANQTFNWVSTAFASNLANGNNLIHFIGQSGSNKNSAYFGFKYAGNGSNDNILTLGLYLVDNVLNINGLGNVGIGTDNPQTSLHVLGSGEGIYVGRIAGNVDFGAHVRIQKARGSVGSPAIVVNGDTTGTLTFEAYNGSGYSEATGIMGIVNGTVSAGSTPTDLMFSAGASGTTAANERMRITSEGVVKIGRGQTTDDGLNPGYKNVAISYNESGDYGDIQAIQQTINVHTLRLNNSGGQVFAGSSRLDNISDQRMKTDIKPITNALSKVKQLTGKKFHLIDEEEGKIRYGFIAQDLEGILDDFIVNTNITYRDQKNNVEIQNVKSIESWASSWAALLVESIKEQQTQIESLKAENKTLTMEMQSIKDSLK
jgi:hypothetical protein